MGKSAINGLFSSHVAAYQRAYGSLKKVIPSCSGGDSKFYLFWAHETFVHYYCVNLFDGN
jgi:hypothetical protein